MAASVNVTKLRLSIGPIFILALIVRIAFYLSFQFDQLPDAIAYLEVGKELFYNGFTYNYKVMPLYPILAFFNDILFEFPLLDIIISSSTVFIIYLISQKIFLSKPSGLIASLVFAIYPFSVFYSVSGLSESIFVFLFLLGLYFIYDRNIYMASIIWVLSILVRPSFDYLFPFLIVYFGGGYGIKRNQFFKIIKNLVTYFIIYICLMAPWWLHNYNRYGQFVKLNLGFGQVLFEGNNEYNKNGGTFDITGLEPYSKKNSSPVEINKALTKSAIGFIQQNPKRFVELSIRKLQRFWNPFPNHPNFQSPLIIFGIGVFTIPILIGSILFFLSKIRINKKTILPLMIIILYLSGIHMLTVGSIRYRYPLDPILIICSTFYFYNLRNKYYR